MINTRYVKALLIASIALFFSLIGFNNLVDFSTNWKFVQHILSMDNIGNENISWRAVQSNYLQVAFYSLIVVWQILTAIFCWIGAFMMFFYKKMHRTFSYAKSIATIGLTMGFLLFMVGFVIIGSEWFYVWQNSQMQRVQNKSILLSILLVVLITLLNTDERNP